jgi:hypothetical protein
MKYKLFPKVDFLAYLKSIHIAYHPGRAKTEVARRLVLQVTSENSKKKYPGLNASWELLGYDAPSSVEVEFFDGRKQRFLAEGYTKSEIHALIDKWQYSAHIDKMKIHSIEKANAEDE